MTKLLALARITFYEGIRNKSVFGVILFSLFIFGLNVAVAGFFMRDIDKVTIDMNLSALSFAGLLLIFFIVINLMAKDIDKKTVHVVLAKPISRVQYVWGKYLGVVLFIAVSLATLFLISCLTVLLVKGLYSDYFEEFSWTVFFVAAIFVFVKNAVLSAVVILFSTITSNSFITLIFSVSVFIVGTTIEEVLFFLKSALSVQEVAISQTLRTVIEFVSYLVPNLAAFDYKTAAAHGLMPTLKEMGFSIGYGIVYIAVLLFFSSILFCRREFN
ncbi:ABC transporter permease [Syntrophotalea acetylenica]|uniref:ABC transporter permease n=1 Tax=Syntrophotalea acetylenica TaxID=29542 RepID=UPI002A35F176|nr:ABC transporter permease [Syntrophotalea acetylenica]MDY0262693.1 ABC transporter permease [Syntrophotalea acetylenica]